MRDPRPVRTLVLLQGLALLLGCAWWVQLPAAARLDALLTVQRQEAIATPPPVGLVTQLEWLYAHRSARLQGLVGLVVVAGIIGIGEGIARRRADVLGGFLLRWWTLGVILLALSPGLIIGALLLPWPLPGSTVGSGLALVTGLMGYGFTCGRPYIP